MAQEIRFTKGEPPRSGPSPLSQQAMLHSRKHEELVRAIEFTIYGVYELARKHIHPSTANRLSVATDAGHRSPYRFKLRSNSDASREVSEMRCDG